MPAPRPQPPLSRRGFLVASAGATAALGLAAVPARAAGNPRPFGRYGSPRRRLTPGTLYVDPKTAARTLADAELMLVADADAAEAAAQS